MRRQLAAHTARSLQPHDHALWSGDGACDLYDLARTALGAGARRNERLLFVAIDPDPARLDGVGDLELLLARGQLELHDVEAIYGASGTFSHTEQLETFEGVLEQALAAGYSGMRVVADNTPLVADASEEAYLSWLRWERLTDGFQAASQVTGICYFDDEALDSERLADLAALHPVRAAGATPPRLRSSATTTPCPSRARSIFGQRNASSASCAPPRATSRSSWISRARSSSTTAHCSH
jgi:hypothetical protein